MRKKYSFVYTVLTVFAIIYLFMFYSSGAPAGYTGSHGEGRNCSACHSGGNYTASVDISHNIPASGYVPGTTYQITVSVNSNAVRHGFEMTSENDSHNRTGTFQSTDGNTQTLSNNQYISHTSSGTSRTSWSFNWTAPAAGTGNVGLYVSVNATNGDNNTSGDSPVTASVTVPEAGTEISMQPIDGIKIFPNPANDYLFISRSNNTRIKRIVITDIQGKTVKSGIYSGSGIFVGDLATGKYFVRIITKEQTGIYPVLIQ
jgi:hypothetical protein